MYVLYGCGNPRVLNLQKQPMLQNVNRKYIIIREMKNCIIYYWAVGTRVKGSVKRMYD
jgi:hypothetical protein